MRDRCGVTSRLKLSLNAPRVFGDSVSNGFLRLDWSANVRQIRPSHIGSAQERQMRDALRLGRIERPLAFPGASFCW